MREHRAVAHDGFYARIDGILFGGFLEVFKKLFVINRKIIAPLLVADADIIHFEGFGMSHIRAHLRPVSLVRVGRTHATLRKADKVFCVLNIILHFIAVPAAQSHPRRMNLAA